MTHTQIVKSGTYASKTGGGTITGLAEINSLVEGSVAFFNEDGTLIPDGGATPLTGDTFHMAVGRASGQGGALIISNIQRDKFGWEPAQTPSAAVNKVMTIGAGTVETGLLNLPTIIDGDIAVLLVENLSKKHDDNTRTQRYEVSLVSTDTATTIISKLVGKVTADTNRIITVADNGAHTGMTITGYTYEDFRVIPMGVLENADILEYHLKNGVYNAGIDTVADVVSFSKGVGTATVVDKLEYDSMINRGHSSSYRPYPGLYGVNTLVEAGALYHIYRCRFENDRVNNPTKASSAFVQELNIAVKDDLGSPIIDITDILAII